jgi:hypothetical protein
MTMGYRYEQSIANQPEAMQMPTTFRIVRKQWPC